MPFVPDTFSYIFPLSFAIALSKGSVGKTTTVHRAGGDLDGYWSAPSVACGRAVRAARRLAGISAMSPRSAALTDSASGK